MKSKPTDKQLLRQKLLKGFYKIPIQERLHRLLDMDVLNLNDYAFLTQEKLLSLNFADQLIENAIGFFPIPFGVALNFVIDGQDYMIPMAVEETSIIAGASYAAKWIRDQGELTTHCLSQLGLGQIQLPKVKDIKQVKHLIKQNKEKLIEKANQEVAFNLFKRGGGVKEIKVREILRPDGDKMAVLHVLVDTCDAMGANNINQICEFLKRPIEELLQEKVGLCILSNLMDDKIIQAKVVIKNIDTELGNAISEASLFAQLDPYRAATNNKGVLNGMDGLLIATGNDWRAVEASIHAYAARSGQYTSITQWVMKENDLHGIIEAPITVGIVGGVTRLHPMAQISLKMLNIKSAIELARIVAAVGLVQNLAALRALVTHGINKGHLKLHISNLAIAVGASEEEIPLLKQQLIIRLEQNKRLTESDAKEVLAQLRGSKSP